MPGSVVQDQIDDLRYSVDVLRGNARELLALVASGEHGPRHEDLVFSSSRRKRDAFTREFYRLLHNYVCSAKTLVDHTRVSHNGLHLPDEIPDYNAMKRKVFEKDPLTQFILRLRVYVSHIRVADLAYQWHYHGEARTATRTLGLRRESLEQWDDWNVPATKYLADAPDIIRVSDFVREYAEKVKCFYEWLDDKLLETTAGRNLLVFRARQEEMLGLNVEMRLLDGPEPSRVSLEERAFGSVLDASEIGQLAKVPAEERPGLAIALLSSYIS